MIAPAQYIANRCIYNIPITAPLSSSSPGGILTSSEGILTSEVINIIASRTCGDRLISSLSNLIAALDGKYTLRASEYLSILGRQHTDVPIVDYIIYTTGIIDAILIAEEKINDEGLIFMRELMRVLRDEVMSLM